MGELLVPDEALTGGWREALGGDRPADERDASSGTRG